MDGESTAAYRMSLTGRRAFWEKMGWTIASATEADCISWGQAAPSLIDFLNDDPPVASPNTFGHALICHVPSDVRASIGWLADQDEGWFYYDPVAGVMSIRRVP